MGIRATRMDGTVKSLPGWWLVLLLSIIHLSAASSDLRLVEAVENGDREAVRSLLRQQVDVNAFQADGATALQWAAHRDDLETAELLIRAGADVNAANDYGITPLSLACTNGSAAMVERLLNSGADPNSARPNGETVLMTAARTGNVEVVKSLLIHGADVNARETRRGQTALMWTISENHPQVLPALIEHGADVHTPSTGGFVPLLFAAQQGSLEAAEILLAAGANVNEAGTDGMTPLLMASASGHEELSLFLLEEGADPNAADEWGMTALHYSLLRGLSALSRVNLVYYTAYLYRPNMHQLAQALLAKGANPNARIVKVPRLQGQGALLNLEGSTPFLLAASAADLSLIRLLADSGADPLLATTENTTPLMVAAGVGRAWDRTAEEETLALQAVKLAVELGADVNKASDSGQTALQGAARTGADAAIQFLVHSGADLEAADRFGQTPLGIAEGVVPKSMSESNFALKPFGPHQSTANLLRELGSKPTTY